MSTGIFNPLLTASSGTGGGGSKNYLAAITTSNGNNTGNGDFETGLTTGFTLGVVGTLTNGLPTGSPTFGSGASGNLSLAIVSSGQLAGTKSLSYVSSAATTQGNMFASDAFNIDNEDQAKVLTWKIYYKAFSGSANCNFSGTSSNSFGVAFYDVTNSSWLGNTGSFGIVQGTGIGYATGTFQTNATTTSIRMCIYNANATSGAVTMYFDDLQCGPQTAPFGPVIADAKTFTPTGNWVTNTTYSGYYTRIGDRAFIEVQAALSGAPTGTFTVNMPPGLVIDSTKMTAALNNLLDNSQARVVAAGQGYIGSVIWQSSTSVGVVSMAGAVSTNAYVVTTATVPATFANGDVVQISFSVPIVGWSSNAVQSSDSLQQVVTTSVTKATQTGVAPNNSAVQLTLDTVNFDTTGSFSSGTSRITCPVSGYYSYSASAQFSSTNVLANDYYFQVYKNGAAIRNQYMRAVAGTGFQLAIADTINCVAGDYFQVFLLGAGNNSASTLTTSGVTLTVSRLSGPAVVQATESVNMRYFSSSTTITGSLATILYNTKGWDTHNAYNAATGIFTAPVSGKYQLNASIAMTGTFILNSILDLQAQQAGSNTQVSEAKSYSGGAVTQMNTNVGDIFYLLAGDTLKIQASNSGTLPVIAATTTQNWLSIARVGN